MKTAQATRQSVERLPLRGETELTIVTPAKAGERAQKLHLEAKKASLEHLAALQTSLEQTRDLAQGVVEAGDLYAPGLQAFTTRLSEELFWRGKSLEALTDRQRIAAAVH